jgi:hypothetical protein
MAQAAFVAEGEIKALTPRKTGRLFAAWTSRVEGVGMDTVGIVSDDVVYAPFVEEGTAPHDITATGRALTIPLAKGGGFGGGRLSGAPRAGQDVGFFARVHHPGTKGAHMAEQGLERAQPGIIRAFELAIQRALSFL